MVGVNPLIRARVYTRAAHLRDLCVVCACIYVCQVRRRQAIDLQRILTGKTRYHDKSTYI